MKNYEAVAPQYNFEEVENYRRKKSKLVEKVERGLEKGAEKVKDKINKAADLLGPEDALLLPIVPFKVAMLDALAQKGIKPTNTHISNVAKLFLTEVVKKARQNYVEHLTDEEKQSAKEQAGTAVKGGAEIAAGDYVGGIKDLVKAIIAYFKGVDDKNKNKKASADEMNQKLLAEKGMEKMATDQTPEQIAKVVTGDNPPKKDSSKMLLYLVVVVAIVFFASRK